DIHRWKQEDIFSLMPAIYPETSGKFFTHDLDLMRLGAISLKKGCYTGQEIIARMHYRGKSKTELLKITRRETLSKGQEFVHSGKKCIMVDSWQDPDTGLTEMLTVASLV